MYISLYIYIYTSVYVIYIYIYIHIHMFNVFVVERPPILGAAAPREAVGSWRSLGVSNTYTCVYIYIYIYTYILFHTYTFKYIYIYTHICIDDICIEREREKRDTCERVCVYIYICAYGLMAQPGSFLCICLLRFVFGLLRCFSFSLFFCVFRLGLSRKHEAGDTHIQSQSSN